MLLFEKHSRQTVIPSVKEHLGDQFVLAEVDATGRRLVLVVSEDAPDIDTLAEELVGGRGQVIVDYGLIPDEFVTSEWQRIEDAMYKTEVCVTGGMRVNEIVVYTPDLDLARTVVDELGIDPRIRVDIRHGGCPVLY